MEKPRVRIENWVDFETFLAGNATDHPRFHSGRMVYTSKILSRDEEKGTVETMNTIYVLGKKAKGGE